LPSYRNIAKHLIKPNQKQILTIILIYFLKNKLIRLIIHVLSPIYVIFSNLCALFPLIIDLPFSTTFQLPADIKCLVHTTSHAKG